MSSVANCVIPSNATNALQNAALAFLTGVAFSEVLATMQSESKAWWPTSEKGKSEAGQKDDAEHSSQMETANAAALVVVQVPVELAPMQATTFAPESKPPLTTPEATSAGIENSSQKSRIERPEKQDSAKPGLSMDTLIRAIAENSTPVAEAQGHNAQNSEQQGSTAAQPQKANPEATKEISRDSQETSAVRVTARSWSVEMCSPITMEPDSSTPAPDPETKASLLQKRDLASKSQAPIGDNPEPVNSGTQVSKTRPAVEIIEVREGSQKPELDSTAKSKPQVVAIHSGTELDTQTKGTGTSASDAIASARETDVTSQLSLRTAMHLERMAERLTGTEFHFGFASSDAGAMKVTATVREGTVDIGVAADRIETASALRAEVPVLESNLRERALHLGEINIGSQTSMNASTYSDGQRRGRPEYLPAQIVSSPAPETISSVAEETPSWVRSDRSSVSLLA